MGQTTVSGPSRSKAGFQTGESGTQLTLIEKDTVSVTVAALAAAAEADVDVTVTGATPLTDMVSVSPPEAAMEAGLSISAAWVSAADTVTIRMSNQSGSGLTGSTEDWQYILTRS